MDNAAIMEQMFYIIDGRGNYYRVNDEDQLITSQNRESADLFGLKEANKRINNGKKMYFYSILPAGDDTGTCPEENTNRVDAQQVQSLAIQEAEAEDITIETNTGADMSYEYDLDQLDWKEYLTHFTFVISGLKKYQDKLNRELSEADMCICDLMHYLELYDLEEAEYIQAAELIKMYRERRRVVKDKFHMTESFQKTIGTNNNLMKAKEAISQINKLEKRNYKPRMLPEIFTGELILTKRREVSAQLETGKEQPVYGEWEAGMEQQFFTGYESENMMESMERRETSFDTGENDWAGFVAQQATFFAEAKQYVCNLQMMLYELDREIEQVLNEVEDANCNAVQGYKVFKQLKDLRNERKRIAKELKCVQTITQCFDCEAMYDAYRYCEEQIQETIN